MMKTFCLVLCVAVGFTNALLPGLTFKRPDLFGKLHWFHSDVNQDIQDFLNLWPLQTIGEKIEHYVETDSEVAKDWEYFRSDDYINGIKAIQQSNEFQVVAQKLESVGVNVSMWVDQYDNQIENLPDFNTTNAQPGTGLKGLLSELEPLIPKKHYYLLFVEKYAWSIDFRAYIALLMDYDFRKSQEALANSDTYKSVINAAVAQGFDIDAYAKFIDEIPHIH